MIVLLIFGIILVPALYIGIGFDPALAHLNYLALYFLPIPLGFVLAYYWFSKRRLKMAIKLIGLSSILGGISFIALVFPRIDQENPVAQSLHLLEGKEIRYFEKFNPSFSFYLQKEIKHLEADEFASFFAEYPDGVIISTKRKLEGVNLPDEVQISFSARDIMERPTTVLLTRKN
jgi:hypothetical protein